MFKPLKPISSELWNNLWKLETCFNPFQWMVRNSNVLLREEADIHIINLPFISSCFPHNSSKNFYSIPKEITLLALIQVVWQFSIASKIQDVWQGKGIAFSFFIKLCTNDNINYLQTANMEFEKLFLFFWLLSSWTDIKIWDRFWESWLQTHKYFRSILQDHLLT